MPIRPDGQILLSQDLPARPEDQTLLSQDPVPESQALLEAEYTQQEVQDALGWYDNVLTRERQFNFDIIA
jgi:hypothetical protein